jgi:hypothetical protein
MPDDEERRLDTNRDLDTEAETGEPTKPEDTDDATEVPIPPEILEKLDNRDRKRLLETFSAFMYSGPAPNPLISKFQPQHITDVFGLMRLDSNHAFADRQRGRFFVLAVILIIVASALTVILTLAIRNQNDLVTEIIKLAAVSLGGVGFGYGFRTWHSS